MTYEETDMKPRERRAWLLNYLREFEPAGTDILNREFVDCYIAATGAKFRPTMWGAEKCPQLGRDLLAMKRLGQVKRWRSGLSGNWQPGFPKWVWCYKAVNETQVT